MQINSLSIKLFLLCSTIAALVTFAQAEEIIIPIANQGAYLGNVERPALGAKRQQVVDRFGEPVTKHPTIGNPPITRWDYQDFSVYFENDVVLHSVLKHRRTDTQTE